ncbi:MULTISPECIES: hypothetical protein [Providencia]|uniref:Uncharacterized protein n=1 Tax=Providencia hangzhouensis TaxID=3031799 RepID=A0ABY9ZG18_9GAMM|nr:MULTISPECIES: hypothetical protein [Providencia]ELR5186773.1 hypothetical protein [Providencia rettgeri]MBS0857961.1 hypothetical protein [Providencia rettgeri]MBS0871700.1 hypothetical protein [Providencia rettgeri]MBS0918846.1 hypothetical protein [Providencia rettgeri]MCB4815113.1 hypothetical protein [Providencia rettgeri]
MYSLEFIISWIKGMGILRIILTLANVSIAFLCFYLLIDIGFFTYKYYNQEKAFICITLFFISALNLFYVIKTKNNFSESKSSLISLWLKRKRLENEAKIKELEK